MTLEHHVQMSESAYQEWQQSKETVARIAKLEVENAALRSALEEIRHHYIDSEFASIEKRQMATRALIRLAP